MKFRFVLLIMLALGLIGGAAAGHDKKGKQPKKINPYWLSCKGHKGPHTLDACENGKKGKYWEKGVAYEISVSALRGPLATGVSVFVETRDPFRFPIPEEFEKLQIKILDQSGNVVSVRNLRDVTITGGEAVVSIEDLYPPWTIEVQVHVKGRKKNTEVLRGRASVLFRPDLVVQQVQAPGQVGPNVLFNIQAVIKETKLQSDATANVSLFDGTTLLSTASGVYVPAGKQVTLLFEAVSLADAGTHDLTIKITDVLPTEYDTSNNELSFSVLVSNPVQPAGYTFTYDYAKNYSSSYGYSYCEESDISYAEGSFTSWTLNTNFSFITTSPIDSIRWEAVTGSGTLTQGFLSEFFLQASNPNFDYYNTFITDEDGSSLYVTMYQFKATAQSNLSVSKIANNFVYVQVMNGDTTSVYEQEQSHQGDLIDYLEVRILFADDGQLAGGSARVDLAPFIHESYDDSFEEDLGDCIYYFIYTESRDYSAGSSFGVTNPAVLPTGSVRGSGSSPILPELVDLVQNYPNPFNPSTNIQFTVNRTGPTVLKVHDMLGKEVAVLFKGVAEQGQVYRVTFQPSGLASGMYYARLWSGGTQYTKKMLLMK